MKFLAALLCMTCLLADPAVIVSVAPYKYFVEKLIGTEGNILLMIPEGASPHTYEPPARTLVEAQNADIWFRIGEGFENKAIASIKAHNPNMVLVDLRKGLNLISDSEHHCCGGHEDLHIWLSLRMALQEAETMADALIQRYPEKKDSIESNLEKFLVELREADKKITQELAPFKGKTIFVSHPAYAYFCRDYGLTQLSIEMEGREPSPKTMNNILKKARSEDIKTVFTQPQYSRKGAEIMSKELGIKRVTLDPYAENYIPNMLQIADAFKKGL